MCRCTERLLLSVEDNLFVHASACKITCKCYYMYVVNEVKTAIHFGGKNFTQILLMGDVRETPRLLDQKYHLANHLGKFWNVPEIRFFAYIGDFCFSQRNISIEKCLRLNFLQWSSLTFLGIFWNKITTTLTPSISEGGEWGRWGLLHFSFWRSLIT